jgi:hypothetical protein
MLRIISICNFQTIDVGCYRYLIGKKMKGGKAMKGQIFVIAKKLNDQLTYVSFSEKLPRETIRKVLPIIKEKMNTETVEFIPPHKMSRLRLPSRFFTLNQLLADQ